MHLLIDLQACQTQDSRHRGIGRYSLALAEVMILEGHARKHKVSMMLSDRFEDTLFDLRQKFTPLLGAKNVHVLALPSPSLIPAVGPVTSAKIDEDLRLGLITQIAPDVVHIASLFEWPEVAATAATRENGPRTVVTLYDLIPLQYPDLYLADKNVRVHYYRRLHSLMQADLILSISESSRKEALDILGLPQERLVNISSAIDRQFRIAPPTLDQEADIRKKYGIDAGYVMYTGGIDHRKNIEGLLAGFACLPENLRSSLQLVVVCSIQSEDRARLSKLARAHGLLAKQVVFTGFVSDAELVALYNLAALFVFPSLHEGFGLPLLEAMACGVPSIGANNSSIPEVLAMPEALFDPRSPQDMARVMGAALSDKDFAQRLRHNGLHRASLFAWRHCANRAWSAIETLCKPADAVSQSPAVSFNKTNHLGRRLRLAFVSPWPPQASGISAYSVRLVVALSRHYDIDLVAEDAFPADHPLLSSFTVRQPDWLREHAADFDRILYHMGNSSFHTYMLELLPDAPGLIVLHDCYLSGLFYHLERSSETPHIFDSSLWRSHGPQAVQHRYLQSAESALYRYTANQLVLQNAIGVITHSEWAVHRLINDHGVHWKALCRTASFACQPKHYSQGRAHARMRARQALRLPLDAFLVCSFGMLDQTKCNLQLLQAWQRSELFTCPDARLVCVGQVAENAYALEIRRLVGQFPSAEITGHVDDKAYALWLDACDVAVQLRTLSRGETSAAIFDCFSHQLALVYNAHGPAAELPAEIAWRLPDIEPEALTPLVVDALNALFKNPNLRNSLAQAGYEWVLKHHHVVVAAQEYHAHIEDLYASSAAARSLVTNGSLAKRLQPMRANIAEVLPILAACTVRNQRGLRGRRLVLDTTALSCEHASTWLAAHLPHWMGDWPADLTMEVVQTENGVWKTHRQAVSAALSVPTALADEDLLCVHEDIWVSLRTDRSDPRADGAKHPGLHAHQFWTLDVADVTRSISAADAVAVLKKWLDCDSSQMMCE